MVLELCNNNSMSELMKRRKKLTEPETRYYMFQLIHALKYLHANLVIHRDLKLGNLFIDSNMRIKVGDFGLATKLTTADEKRKTICGTPNYIAPEILEGKEGHSFEVDVWSTGVILYTLLIGKPPFETKDVKSTYKRILANQYVFPDHAPIEENAKHLIKNILQTRPEKRPTLDQLLNHAFFTSSNAIMPTILPESCLRDAPLHFNTDTVSLKMAATEKVPLARLNDENDPSAINRGANYASAPVNRMLKGSVTSSISTTTTAATSVNGGVDNDISDEPVKVLHQPVPVGTRRGSFGSHNSAATTRATSSTVSNSNNHYDIGGGVKPSLILPAPVPKTTGVSKIVASSATHGVTNTVDNHKPSKFDVYVDNKSTVPPPPPTAVTTNPRRVVTTTNRTSSIKETAISNTYRSEKGICQQFSDMEIVENSSKNAPATTWMDTKSPSVTAPKATAVDAEAMVLGTPEQQIVTVQTDKPPGTLETMHDMLTNTVGLFDEEMAVQTPVVDHHVARNLSPSSALVANIWVVRYVDYTSKYGLGFLLNTGSAGVYFNDSTKIILSPNGQVFQYIERKRKESSSSQSEHVTQTHSIAAYPVELQKKVTLLRHFRDYMVDQQRTYTRSANDVDMPASNDNGDGQGMPMVLQQGGIASGATSSIKFGVSSAKYSSGYSNSGDNMSSSELMSDDDCEELPFLKKWVRTRHAILFRLSNRTVQVVFFDRSEILLSSEARIVTFVNKQGVRSEHSLEEVLAKGRADICKRLKYTKDIMYRLIHISQR